MTNENSHVVHSFISKVKNFKKEIDSTRARLNWMQREYEDIMAAAASVENILWPQKNMDDLMKIYDISNERG